jgi:hypothetical protein
MLEAFLVELSGHHEPTFAAIGRSSARAAFFKLHRNECGAKNGGSFFLRAECRTFTDELVAQLQHGIVEIVAKNRLAQS